LAGAVEKSGMKILQITNKVPVPPKDGGSIASFRLSEGLEKMDQEVHILAMNTSKHFVNQDVISSFEKPGLKITPVWMNTKLSPLKALANLLFSKMPYNAVRFISSGFKKKLIEHIVFLLNNFNPDLIILENLYPAAYLQEIRNYSDAPVIYRAHNIENEIWQRTAANSKGLRKLYLNVLARRIKRFETGVINQYDILMPITQRDADSLNEMGNKKPVFVLPTGYHMSGREIPKLNIGKSGIAHLGALDWLPNQEGILWFIEHVWPILRNTLPDIEFHIAGRNAPKWLENKLDLPGINYLGEIEDAKEFLDSNPIHIVPLFSGSGMRIKIVETMAHGRAVITTTIGTEGIDTKHDENILIADSADAFVKAILKLTENEDYCREIGKNASTFVNEKLNNEKLVSEFLDFVAEVI